MSRTEQVDVSVEFVHCDSIDRAIESLYDHETTAPGTIDDYGFDVVDIADYSIDEDEEQSIIALGVDYPSGVFGVSFGMAYVFDGTELQALEVLTSLMKTGDDQ